MRFWGLIAALLVACNDDGDVTIDVTHDACAPLALVSAAPTEVQRAGLESAQSLWRDRGAPSLGLRAAATLEVRFEAAAAAFHGLYDDEQGVIYINQDIANETVLSIVIAHELGHAFGLPHVEDRESLMNPGNLYTPPTAADQEALQLLWGTCN